MVGVLMRFSMPTALSSAFSFPQGGRLVLRVLINSYQFGATGK